MKEALFPRRDALRRGGFTLVEVVIALAIFLFGALAIIRIFPPALGVIQNSGDKLTALNLNRTSLARFAKESSAIPDAVHDAYYPVPNEPPIATAVVGSAIRNNSLPKRNVQIIDDSALNHFKYISGEKQKVKSVTVKSNMITPPTVTLNYVLTSFPIAAPDKAPITNSPIPFATIYTDTPVTGVVSQTKVVGKIPMRQSGYLDFTEASPKPVYGSPTQRNNFYYATYRYLENGVLNSTTDEAVRLSTPNPLTPNLIATDLKIETDAQLLQGRRLGGSLPAPAPLTGSRVIDGPISLRFREQLAPSNVVISDDPIIQNTLNNLGILVLTGVSKDQEVTVDYRINDWRQIVSDGSPSITPESTPTPGSATTPSIPTQRTAREIVLPIKPLSDGGDGTTPQPALYSFLSYIDHNPTVPDPPFTTLQANGLDVLDNLAALTTTDPNPSHNSNNLTVDNPFFLWAVNRKAGRVVFDINDHKTVSPKDYQILQSRVVYQTLENWAHQISVAPTSYTPFYSNSLNNVNTNANYGGITGNVSVAQPWRYYYWESSSSQPGRIFFPPSEAGKTISLSYTYDANGTPREINGGVVTINSGWIQASQAPAAAQPLAIADANGDSWLAFAEPQLNNNTVAPLLSIRAINGISIQARTAWLDGSNFNQVSTVGFRGGKN